MNRLKTTSLILVLLLALLSVLMFNAARNSMMVTDSGAAYESNAVELNLTHWINIPSSLLERFEEENPNIKINYIRYNISAYDKAAILDRLPRGDIDVLGVREADYLPAVRSLLLLDLTDQAFMARCGGGARASVAAKYDGREYALPLSGTYYGMWYNKAVFERHGLSAPRTYDQFLNICQELKNHGIAPIVLGGGDYDAGLAAFLMTMSDGGNEGGVSADFLRRTEDLIDAGYVYEQSAEFTFQQAFEVFKRGRAAMFPAPDYSVNLCGMDMEKVIEPGVCPIPYSNAVQMVPCIPADNMTAVSAYSDLKTEAMQFLDYLSRPEVSAALARENGWTSTIGGGAAELPYADDWSAVRALDILDISQAARDLPRVKNWANQVRLMLLKHNVK